MVQIHCIYRTDRLQENMQEYMDILQYTAKLFWLNFVILNANLVNLTELFLLCTY